MLRELVDFLYSRVHRLQLEAVGGVNFYMFGDRRREKEMSSNADASCSYLVWEMAFSDADTRLSSPL